MTFCLTKHSPRAEGRKNANFLRGRMEFLCVQPKVECEKEMTACQCPRR